MIQYNNQNYVGRYRSVSTVLQNSFFFNQAKHRTWRILNEIINIVIFIGRQ